MQFKTAFVKKVGEASLTVWLKCATNKVGEASLTVWLKCATKKRLESLL